MKNVDWKKRKNQKKSSRTKKGSRRNWKTVFVKTQKIKTTQLTEEENRVKV